MPKSTGGSSVGRRRVAPTGVREMRAAAEIETEIAGAVAQPQPRVAPRNEALTCLLCQLCTAVFQTPVAIISSILHGPSSTRLHRSPANPFSPLIGQFSSPRNALPPHIRPPIGHPLSTRVSSQSPARFPPLAIDWLLACCMFPFSPCPFRNVRDATLWDFLDRRQRGCYAGMKWRVCVEQGSWSVGTMQVL